MTPRLQFLPRALRRTGAAFYLSVSPTTFDTWVKRGVMPQPNRYDGVVFWDRHEIDDAFQAMIDGQPVSTSAQPDVGIPSRSDTMPKRLPKYCCEWRDRHGKMRVYFRRKGQHKIRLHGLPWSAPFMEQYARALEGIDVSEQAPLPAKETVGTWKWLCLQYFGSADFNRMEVRGQGVRRSILESTFSEAVSPGSSVTFDRFPLSKMLRKAVKVLRDRKIATPAAANERLKAIRQVFAYGLEDHPHHVSHDPARQVAYFKTRTLGFHTWSRDEVGQYLDRHAPGSQARLALFLLLYTGARRSDVVRLGPHMIEHRWLTYQARKTRLKTPEPIRIPVLPALASELPSNVGKQRLPFLVTERGQAFSAAGFGNKFKRWCVEAGLPHCTAHGLRKAGATFAAENGATESQLRAMFGWSSAKMPAHYTRKAQQKVLAASGMGYLEFRNAPLIIEGDALRDR